MLGGVAFCSFAGRWKEKQPAVQRRSYSKGVLLCAASGLLSACGNLGFAFGQPIIDRAQAAGVAPDLASNVVWALLTLALFLCNAGYAIRLLFRNRTGAKFGQPGTHSYFILGILMGVMWMGGFVFYGAGARRLGRFGPSIGWAILMSAMVLTANILGVVTGEWKGAPPAATRTLCFGLGLLLFAITLLAYTNSLTA